MSEKADRKLLGTDYYGPMFTELSLTSVNTEGAGIGLPLKPICVRLSLRDPLLNDDYDGHLTAAKKLSWDTV